MKAHRVILLAIVTGWALGFIGVHASRADMQVGARIQIVPHPSNDFRIWIWPDRGEEATYREGEPIAINVQATRDCFLILYDIDTRGDLHILFPPDPWADNFVRGGQTIRLPRPEDPFEWTVDGPAGVEYVQAIASEFPINPPDWPVYMRSVNGDEGVSYDPELRDFHADDDRLEYMGLINRRITGRYWDWCATDLATFHVRPRYVRAVYWNGDPWPDQFYGEVYIGWPIGGRIYVDNVYIGVAPLWVPHHSFGRHLITCYDGSRLVRRHTAVFFPKAEYRYGSVFHGGHGFRGLGAVKAARRDAAEVWGFDRNNPRAFRRQSDGNDDDRPERRAFRVREHDEHEGEIERRSEFRFRAAPAERIEPQGVTADRERTDVRVPRDAPSPESRAAQFERKPQRESWMKSVATAVIGAARNVSESRAVARQQAPGRDRESTRSDAGDRGKVRTIEKSGGGRGKAQRAARP